MCHIQALERLLRRAASPGPLAGQAVHVVKAHARVLAEQGLTEAARPGGARCTIAAPRTRGRPQAKEPVAAGRATQAAAHSAQHLRKQGIIRREGQAGH